MVNSSPELALKLAEKRALEKKQASKEAKELEESPEDSDSFSYSPIKQDSPSNFSFKSLFSTSGKKKKKFGPLAIFIVVLLAFVVISFTSTSLLPGHIDANTQEAFDVQYTASKLALKTVTIAMLENGSLPSGFAERLTESGLEVGYLDGNSGEFIAGLRPNDDSVIALASATDGDKERDHSLVLRFGDNIITSKTFGDYFDYDPEAYAAFSEATYGRAMNHYDTAANNFYANTMSSNRNVFKNYQITGNNSSDTEAFNIAFKAIFGNTDSLANTVVEVNYNFENDIPASNPTGYHKRVYGCYAINDKKTWLEYETLEQALPDPEPCWKPIKNIFGQIIGWEFDSQNYELIDTDEKACTRYGVINDVQTEYIDGTCYANILESDTPPDALDQIEAMSYSIFNSTDAQAKAVSIVSQAVNANETYQAMEYYLTIEEAISKMKAGLGSESPINAVLNMLTVETTSTDQKGNTHTGSAVQSPALAAVLTKSYSSSLPNEVANNSVDRLIDSSSTAFINLFGSGSELASTEPVEVGTAAEALLSASSATKTQTGSFIKDFGYFFIGKIEEITASAAGGIVSSLAPSISQSVLTTNPADYSGIMAGDFFAMGGSALGSKIATFTSGATIGDFDTIASYQKDTSRILAMDAAASRLNSSPFDITNSNTFLGSIASDFSSLMIKNPSLLSTFSTMSSLTSSSIKGLLPGAFADSAELEFQTLSGTDCPSSSNMGSQGNIWCIPTVTFDTASIESALSDSGFDKFLRDNTEESTEADSSGKETTTYVARTNSDLDVFMSYNSGREANFGQRNSNIYNSLVNALDGEDSIKPEAGGGFFSRIKDAIKKFFAKIKNIFSAMFNTNSGKRGVNNELITERNEQKSARVARIATGEEFLNASSSKYWNTYKYAQAYVIYNRILDQIDYFSPSNENTTALSKYFTPGTGTNPSGDYIAAVTSHPENETDIEYLSRISGLTPSESEFALNYVAVETYLASLDRTTLFAFLDFVAPDSTSTPTIDLFAAFHDSDNSIEEDQKSTPILEKRREVYYV